MQPSTKIILFFIVLFFLVIIFGKSKNKSKNLQKFTENVYRSTTMTNSVWIYNSNSIDVFKPKYMTPLSKVVVIGVGTAMSKEDYQILADLICKNGFYCAIIDNNPGFPTKTSASQYASVYNTVKDLFAYNNIYISQYYAGGHSASGEACIYAINKKLITTSGFIGLDPYKYSDISISPNVKSLFWGFNASSCGVDISEAGVKFFNSKILTNTNPYYLYKVNSSNIYHCDFTDGGCGVLFWNFGVCGLGLTDLSKHTLFINTVADSIASFCNNYTTSVTIPSDFSIQFLVK